MIIYMQQGVFGRVDPFIGHGQIPDKESFMVFLNNYCPDGFHRLP